MVYKLIWGIIMYKSITKPIDSTSFWLNDCSQATYPTCIRYLQNHSIHYTLYLYVPRYVHSSCITHPHALDRINKSTQNYLAIMASLNVDEIVCKFRRTTVDTTTHKHNRRSLIFIYKLCNKKIDKQTFNIPGYNPSHVYV